MPQTERQNSKDTDVFRFVSVSSGPQERSHAMRAHWRQRRRQSIGGTSVRNNAQNRLRPLLPLQREGQGSETATHPVENVQDTDPSVTAISEQLPETGKLAGTSLSEPPRMSRTPGNGRLDPFDGLPVRLTNEHHKLLHHWLATGATMMSNDLPSSIFNSARDVWLPLDLSNAASFNACMAHSAAHLDLMQGEECSEKAVEFKTEAVRIVSEWTGDPAMVLSDDMFAAVLRLLTYERYWGTESEWKVRHECLLCMIGARGGVGAFANNWRLALATFLTTLMVRPTWLDSSNRIWELVVPQSLYPLQVIVGDELAPTRIRCLWLLSLVQDMEHFALSSVELYRSRLTNHANIQDALTLLKHKLDQYDQSGLRGETVGDGEYRRLACVLFIAILCQRSTTSPSDASTFCQLPSWNSGFSAFSALDSHLGEYLDTWSWDVDGLYIALYNGFFTVDYGIPDRDYVLSMTSVLGSMSCAARQGVERRLLHILCQCPAAWSKFPSPGEADHLMELGLAVVEDWNLE